MLHFSHPELVELRSLLMGSPQELVLILNGLEKIDATLEVLRPSTVTHCKDLIHAELKEIMTCLVRLA